MDKFSKISKVKVNSEPKIEVNERDEGIRAIKYAVNKLIKEFLQIRIEGPIDPILVGTIKLSGQEEFIDSVLDLFETEEVSDTLKLLQEAKFNGIDNSIINYENILLEKQTQSMLSNHDKRIKNIMTKSEGDNDKAIKLAETQVDRIKSGEKCFYRGLSAEKMIGKKDEDGNLYPKKTLKEISDLFFYKSKQLGYRK